MNDQVSLRTLLYNSERSAELSYFKFASKRNKVMNGIVWNFGFWVGMAFVCEAQYLMFYFSLWNSMQG
jgi:hypothetical protein